MSVPIDMDLGPPPRTIYEDIVNLPDPVYLGITSRFHNYDDVGLYFRITASCTGWTFGTVNLGLVGAGASITRTLDNFGNRAKPTAEVEQTIDFYLRAYTDSGYTNLKWEFHRDITIKFIKSDDPSYTVDVLNNFDDGTKQGWGAYVRSNATWSSADAFLAIVSDYVLSAPYSIRLQFTPADGSPRSWQFRKQFALPDRPIIYAIIDVRLAVADPKQFNYWEVRVEETVTTTGGVMVYINYYTPPKNKWFRVVVPLPRNVTRYIEIETRHDDFYAYQFSMWMDDFKIISKSL